MVVFSAIQDLFIRQVKLKIINNTTGTERLQSHSGVAVPARDSFTVSSILKNFN
jgi:hypothetical protein